MSAPTIRAVQEEYETVDGAIEDLERAAATANHVLRVLRDRRRVLRDQIEEAEDALHGA